MSADRSVLARQRVERANRRSLADTVFDRIVKSIKSGSYGSGERLPTEHALAAEFQVSRPIVREALRRLRELGLVYSRQGAGTFVRETGLRDPLGFGPVESNVDLAHCYEFRISLEPEAAAAAAERRTEADLAAIAAALDNMRDATARRQHREDIDFMFHGAIARASGNRYFEIALDALKENIGVGMKVHGKSLKASVDGLDEVWQEHSAIYEAIRQGQPELARSRMRAHLIHSQVRLTEDDEPSL